MRCSPVVLLLACLMRAHPACSQAVPPNGKDRWVVSFDLDHGSFAGGSLDTASVPGMRIIVLPANHFAMTAGLARRFGLWELGLGLGRLTTYVQAEGPAVEYQDKTQPWYRYRLELLFARRLLRFPQGRLALRAGPTLDVWAGGGFEGRVTPGGRAEMSLELKLGGPVEVANRVGIGWSASPFTANDTPPGVERKPLRTLALGTGLRIRL